MGLTRFDGHLRSVGAVSPREDVHHGRHGKKPRRPRRAFTPEFKAEIVAVCRRGDRTVGQVAKDFDLTETAVRDWVKQAGLDVGTRSDGLTTAERDELAQLRRENRRLREDVDILKRATAFFAKETR
ncbi:transposase [Micromonospora sp. NPDC005161]